MQEGRYHVRAHVQVLALARPFDSIAHKTIDDDVKSFALCLCLDDIA